MRLLFDDDDRSKLPQNMIRRIGTVLLALDTARSVEAMDLPGLRLHPLKGELAGFWSLTVSANWRIVFRFDGENAFDVDFVDYH
ncbi:MAG: type II toxin-antitoxin system RelE/ParE family toxin [Caulobacteraceae bacterium]